jgi:hypothetical protein
VANPLESRVAKPRELSIDPLDVLSRLQEVVLWDVLWRNGEEVMSDGTKAIAGLPLASR